MNGSPVTVLSPHLDDAVLSLGGAIAEWTQAGRRVEVLTPFCADEPAGEPLSDLVGKLHGLFGRETGVLEARRDEDREAVSALGAVPIHGPLLEALYRADDRGRAIYPDLRSLFARIRPEDGEVEARLADLCAERATGRLWLAPLGVGAHVDHQLVRRAAERTAADRGADLAFYEEVPYVLRWRALSKALGRRKDWNAETVRVSGEALERKLGAVAAYRSQIRALFGSRRAMVRTLRRFHRRRRRGERLWRRHPGP